MIKASLAELTEGSEGKICFACPKEFSGQVKKLFWRIGLSPILQKKNTLTQRPLRLERVMLSRDEWAVKFYVTYLLLLLIAS